MVLADGQIAFVGVMQATLLHHFIKKGHLFLCDLQGFETHRTIAYDAVAQPVGRDLPYLKQVVHEFCHVDPMHS